MSFMSNQLTTRKVGAPSRRAEYIDVVKRLYVQEERSLSEISQEVPVSVQTLSRWLQSEGVAIEARTRNPNAGRTPEQQAEINERISQTRREGAPSPGRPRAPRETRTCVCGAEFTVLASSPAASCSTACARKAGGARNRAAKEARWDASDESMCPCGVNRIPYENRNIWSYCSDECRAEHGKVKKPNPALQVTFTCGNCKGEFTRRRRKTAEWKYCSNACATKHTRKVRRYVVRDMDMVLDSRWEMLFAGLCSWQKISCTRIDRSRAVDVDGTLYAPDFAVRLGGREVSVEVKGWDTGTQRGGWAAWREQRGPLIVVDFDLMGRLRVADNIAAVLEAAIQ